MPGLEGALELDVGAFEPAVRRALRSGCGGCFLRLEVLEHCVIYIQLSCGLPHYELVEKLNVGAVSKQLGGVSRKFGGHPIQEALIVNVQQKKREKSIFCESLTPNAHSTNRVQFFFSSFIS